MVGSQLAEWSLLIPDVRGSNPVTNKFMINIFTVNCWKDEHKEKKAENGQFYKITIKRFYQDKESNHQEKKRERKKLKKYFCVICIGLTCLSKTNIWSWTAKEEGFDQGSQLFNRIKASSSLYFLSYYLDKNILTEHKNYCRFVSILNFFWSNYFERQKSAKNFLELVTPWSSLVVGDEDWISPSMKLLCLC